MRHAPVAKLPHRWSSSESHYNIWVVCACVAQLDEVWRAHLIIYHVELPHRLCARLLCVKCHAYEKSEESCSHNKHHSVLIQIFVSQQQRSSSSNKHWAISNKKLLSFSISFSLSYSLVGLLDPSAAAAAAAAVAPSPLRLAPDFS